MSASIPQPIEDAFRRDAPDLVRTGQPDGAVLSMVLNLAEAAALIRCSRAPSQISSTARFVEFRGCQLCALGAGCCFGVSPLNSGFSRSNQWSQRARASRTRSGTQRWYDAKRTRSSAGDARKEQRASKAISARLCSKGEARP